MFQKKGQSNLEDPDMLLLDPSVRAHRASYGFQVGQNSIPEAGAASRNKIL